MGYAGATKVLLLKNARLSYRDWGSLLIQVLATFVAIAILKLSQVGTDNNSFAPELKSDLRPEATPVPTIPRCIALETDSCITLAYAPSADARVKRYVDAVAKGAGIPADEVQGHAGSAELNKELLARPNRTQAAYVFEDEDLDALTDGNVRFIVQVNLTEQANFPIGKSKHTELIVAPAMLHAMNSVMFGELSEGEMDVKLSLSVFSHPDLPGIQDAFTEDGPLLLYGVYFISFVLFLYKIVDEKERGMRDYMKLSGLAQSQHYISWGLPFLAFFLVQTLLIIAFGAMFRFRFFTETNFLVYFFTLFLFGFALVGWVFLFEVLIKRTRQVPTISFNFFILSYLISSAGSVVYVEDADGEPVVGGNIVYTLRKVFACLPSTVFTKCIRDISQRAATGFGMSFSQASSYTDVFPITTCWLWMLGSGVVALLLAMYFDNIVSTPNGVGLSPLYLFTPSYWGFGADKEALVSRGENVGSDKDGSSANEGDEPVAAPVQSVDSVEGTYDESREDGDVRREREAIESRARDHRPLVIKNLVKRYGKLNAVDGLNLSVPRNTVTAVLGPNGCGKSTSLKVISSAIAATSGDVLVYGKSTRTSKIAIRKTLGLCPQQDMYYDKLTAAEHVDLFAALKGIDKAERVEEVDRRLEEVGLTHAANRYAKSFSGGMLRRLTVCLALTGDPAIVALDECSHGADVVARRDLWRIVEKAKLGRVIILVTHSMEEAEALSDQIAIMGNGKLRVLGTALELKRKFGAGMGVTVSTRSKAAAEKILDVLNDLSPGSRIEKMAGSENGRPDAVIAEYGLARHLTDDQMTEVVTKLEQRREELEIERFSAQHATLDSVFKRIASLSAEKDDTGIQSKSKFPLLRCCQSALPGRGL